MLFVVIVLKKIPLRGTLFRHIHANFETAPRHRLNGVSNAALRANLKTFDRSKKDFQTKKLHPIENSLMFDENRKFLGI